jgi:hypothetical protein
MARISTYDIAKPVVGQDRWIGSDSQNNDATRNFTANDVAIFINKTAGESQLLRYIYSTGGVNARPESSITLPTGGAATQSFASLNNIVLSKYAENQGGTTLNVSSWYTSPLVGSEILITQCDDITQWGIYKWDSAAQKGGEIDFYEIGLTLKASTGSLTEDKEYFISLLTYNVSAQGDANFVGTLNGNAAIYTISHNLNKYPSVTVTEKDGSSDPTEEIACSVIYLNLNQIRVEFNSNFAGKIICN